MRLLDALAIAGATLLACAARPTAPAPVGEAPPAPPAPDAARPSTASEAASGGATPVVAAAPLPDAGPATSAVHAPAPGDIHVSVDRKGVTLDGVALGAAPTLAAFEALLGPADRTRISIDRLSFYDAFGIRLWDLHDGRVTTLGIQLRHDRASKDVAHAASWPHSDFSGELALLGQRLDGSRDIGAFVRIRGLTAEGPDHATWEKGSNKVWLDQSAGALEEVEISFEGHDRRKGVPHPEEAACLDGHDDDSCENVIDYYQELTDKKATAFDFARRGCDLGSGKSCLALGHAYDQGEGTSPSKAAAKAAFARACTLGNKDGCEKSRGR